MKLLGRRTEISLRFRKAGRVWCDGARETHSATCHNRETPSKTKESRKLSCFLGLNGRNYEFIAFAKSRGRISSGFEFVTAFVI